MSLVTAFALFDIPGSDSTPPPSGPRRCGRERKTKDGGQCKAFPGPDKPACPHHIHSDELALVEQRLRGVRPAAA